MDQASASINAGVIDVYPSCAEAMLEVGWEFIGHGMHQKSMQAELDEASIVQASLEKTRKIHRREGTRLAQSRSSRNLGYTRYSKTVGRRLCM